MFTVSITTKNNKNIINVKNIIKLYKMIIKISVKKLYNLTVNNFLI